MNQLNVDPRGSKYTLNSFCALLRICNEAPVAVISAPLLPFARLLPVVLAGYPKAAEVAADVRIDIVPDRESNNWRVSFDDEPPYVESNPSDATRRAEWLLVAEGLRRVPHLLHAHAAVIATPGRSFLLVGQPGSGKSSCSVSLARAGLNLYSDNVALIDRESLRPFSVPRPIKLDPYTRRSLVEEGLFISAQDRIGDFVCRTALPGLPDFDMPGPPVDTLFFLTGERRNRPRLRKLTQADAAFRLIRQSASEVLAKGMPSDTALALVSRSDCFELVPGEMADTVSAILNLVQA